MKIRFLLVFVAWAISFALPTFAQQKDTGFWSNIYRREGNTWKILMDTSNVTPAPAASPSPTPTASNK
jgi:hypothetical protein